MMIWEVVHGAEGVSAEFRRRALDLVAAGKTVAEVARLLEVSDQSIYSWRRQALNRSWRVAGVGPQAERRLRRGKTTDRSTELLSLVAPP
jgi:transposase-like protein